MPDTNGVDLRFLGGEPAVISDTRDFALVVMVSTEGVADVSANGISHEQGAEWMRHIAAGWAPDPTENLWRRLLSEARAMLTNEDSYDPTDWLSEVAEVLDA